jgi:Na+-driven multidrug efflux pump
MRTFTLNLQAGLKAAGDIRFGLMLVTIQMWGITIPSSYVLTQYFRAGLKGIWVILMIDEFIRIFFFFQRWRSQKWKQL